MKAVFCICTYVYMDGKAPNTRAFMHSSPPCGDSISWHMMEEQTKKNHLPLEDWTCQPPPVAVAVVALPEWQGAPSSPAGEEVKRKDKKTGWIESGQEFGDNIVKPLPICLLFLCKALPYFCTHFILFFICNFNCSFLTRYLYFMHKLYT